MMRRAGVGSTGPIEVVMCGNVVLRTHGVGHRVTHAIHVRGGVYT